MKRNPQDIERAAKIFKVLAHPARLEIACRLAEGGASQKHLVEELGWPQSSMARFLAPLRDTGIVQGERLGPEVQLSVVSPIIQQLVESVCAWLHDEQTDADSPSSH